MTTTDTATRIVLGGCDVDLVDRGDALAAIRLRSTVPNGPPLAVVSVNLDHVHHFGSGARWHGVLDSVDSTGLDWLNLIDGAPLASQAARITGAAWPRLAGSDLAGAILAEAELSGASVGFLGGSPETHELLRVKLPSERPALIISGYWSPSRDDLEDPERAESLAREIASTGTDILIVGLGKPRQELWIAEYGAVCGARVLLAFGAVVDFLADRVARSPEWIAAAGLEWAWRLSKEPRRLAHRYLLDGPSAYLSVRRNSAPSIEVSAPLLEPHHLDVRVQEERTDRFVTDESRVEATVVIVTYNSADHLDALLAGLRAESDRVSLRVVIADNGSTDSTLDIIGANSDLITVETGGNVGYAQGINCAMQRAGDCGAVLVLNPDLTIEHGAVRAMLDRLAASGAGVVVPRIIDAGGQVYPSLRREPTIINALGEAVFGSHFASRPDLLSEIDRDAVSYRHAHPVEWATGAALLIDRRVTDAVGAWDSRFFLYSEETDFFHRVRLEGFPVWFEPAAVVRHEQGGSGTSAELATLMAVNRVRYVRKIHGRRYAGAFRSVVILHELMRARERDHRDRLRVLLRERSWDALPQASRLPSGAVGIPIGSVLIPAHNEAGVIGRTLRPLAAAARSGRLEVVVVCNGCSDDTAAIAQGFAGVRVVETSVASKASALNSGDQVATAWPRLYLDADIEITPGAIAAVFAELVDANRLAARPRFRYDTGGASLLVRAYYRARDRMPAMSASLWGAGAYAVDRNGHDRIGSFPPLLADDLFVDASFSPHEKMVVETQAVRVRTPRSIEGLLAILSRQRRGNLEAGFSSTTSATLRGLLGTVRGPVSLFDAAVYAGLTIAGRRAVRTARASDRSWERDDSSR
ncbi:MAG: WecB/TagA/CpsF family glycosyltransferase [Actinomycetota bacterium]